MGIERNSAKALMEAFRDGVSFERTVTVGRQFLTVTPSWIARQLRSMKTEPASVSLPPESDASWQFAEPFFRMLGAQQIDSIDASSYEGATITHDLNHPVPHDLAGKYDVVYDSGALEHIFNFPVAVGNLMKLTAVGGRLIVHTPINNWCGHGFYQFSPELFYKVLSTKNGFQVERMLAVEMFFDGYWYEVMDPSKLGGRVELVNECRVHLFVQAHKLEEVDLFRQYPQQGDYEATWNGQRTMPAPEIQRSRSSFVLPVLGSLLRRSNPGLLRWFRLRRAKAETRRFSFARQPKKYRRRPSQ